MSTTTYFVSSAHKNCYLRDAVTREELVFKLDMLDSHIFHIGDDTVVCREVDKKKFLENKKIYSPVLKLMPKSSILSSDLKRWNLKDEHIGIMGVHHFRGELEYGVILCDEMFGRYLSELNAGNLPNRISLSSDDFELREGFTLTGYIDDGVYVIPMESPLKFIRLNGLEIHTDFPSKRDLLIASSKLYFQKYKLINIAILFLFLILIFK